MIETERLLLRPFCEDDAADVFEYVEKPQVNCFACMKQDSVEQVRKMLSERNARGGECFAIVLKETGKVIGEIEAHGENAAPAPDATARDGKPLNGFAAAAEVYQAIVYNNPQTTYARQALVRRGDCLRRNREFAAAEKSILRCWLPAEPETERI